MQWKMLCKITIYKQFILKFKFSHTHVQLAFIGECPATVNKWSWVDTDLNKKPGISNFEQLLKAITSGIMV